MTKALKPVNQPLRQVQTRQIRVIFLVWRFAYLVCVFSGTFQLFFSYNKSVLNNSGWTKKVSCLSQNSQEKTFVRILDCFKGCKTRQNPGRYTVLSDDNRSGLESVIRRMVRNHFLIFNCHCFQPTIRSHETVSFSQVFS